MRRGLRFALIGLVAAATVVQAAGELFEQITVADGSVPSRMTTTLITPDGETPMQAASCRVRAAQISMAYDGTTPTTGVGILVDPGETIWIPGHDRLLKFRAVPSTGVVAKLDCTYSPTSDDIRVLILNTGGTARAVMAPSVGPGLPLPVCNPVTKAQGNCRP